MTTSNQRSECANGCGCRPHSYPKPMSETCCGNCRIPSGAADDSPQDVPACQCGPCEVVTEDSDDAYTCPFTRDQHTKANHAYQGDSSGCPVHGKPTERCTAQDVDSSRVCVLAPGHEPELPHQDHDGVFREAINVAPQPTTDAPAAVDVLREVEWSYRWNGEYWHGECPSCGQLQPHDEGKKNIIVPSGCKNRNHGHAKNNAFLPDCRLKAAIEAEESWAEQYFYLAEQMLKLAGELERRESVTPLGAAAHIREEVNRA